MECNIKNLLPLLLKERLVEFLDIAYHEEYISYTIIKEYYKNRKGISISGEGIKKNLSKLESYNLITEVAKGIYALTDKGRGFVKCLHAMVSKDPYMGG